MAFTKKEIQLINKYYSELSKKSLEKRKNLKEHIYLVESISKKIINLYTEVCSNTLLDEKISSIELASIKYSCLFHDIGKTVKWKIDGKDMHIDKGIEIITSTEFKKDFEKMIGVSLSENEIDKTWEYIISAIQLHKSFHLSIETYLSSFVSAIVYSSDKIAHIDKKKKFKKRRKYYFEATKKIQKLIQKINEKYPNDINFELLILCITKVLLSRVPDKNECWTIFGEKY